MIYLIGGPPRVGKSTLAQMLTSKNAVPFAPTDAIFHMLMETAPQIEVHDKKGFEDKAKRFYPFLRKFLLLATWTVSDYCIEGDSFLPVQVNDLLNDPQVKDEKIQIKCCFLGMSETNLETILKEGGRNQWLATRSREKQEKVAKHIVERSELTRKECEKYKIAYFDLAGDYKANLEKAYQYLITS